jgi:hypothetical protein
MRRLLLDANMPRGLRALLRDYEVRTAGQMGWGQLTNGELLAAAEVAGFDAMITADRNSATSRTSSAARSRLSS